VEAQSFYQMGISPKVDVLDAETRLGEAEEQLILAENDFEVAKAYFNTILRQPMDTPVELTDIISTKSYLPTYEATEEIALRNRPELLEAEKNLSVSEKEVTLTKSAYYPTFNFSYNWYRRGDDPTVNGSEFVDRENWDIVVYAKWTLFEWGKTHYTASEKQTRVSQAEKTLEKIKDSIRLEVKRAFLNLRAVEKAILVAEKKVVSAEKNFSASQKRYREQVATVTEALDAQNRLTRAKASYADAIVASALSRARLFRAMGLEE
jgi:outer membrane protein